jgi:hypothetical protein
MSQKFTLIVAKNFFSVAIRNHRQLLSPKKRTLSFIKQFAYAYHVENNLPQSLSAMVLN